MVEVRGSKICKRAYLLIGTLLYLVSSILAPDLAEAAPQVGKTVRADNLINLRLNVNFKPVYCHVENGAPRRVGTVKTKNGVKLFTPLASRNVYGQSEKKKFSSAVKRCKTLKPKTKTGTPTPTPTHVGFVPPQIPTVTPIPVVASLCSDGIDNDGDGKIDLADPGCGNSAGMNEIDGCGENYRIYYNVEDRAPERHAAIGRSSASPLDVGKSAMIYSGDFALPTLDDPTNPCGNFIPQEGIANIACHLQVLDENLPWRMSRNIEGVVIIDIEAYDPVWSTIPNEYKVASRARVSASHPGWNSTQIETEAAREWHDATTDFFLAILRRIKTYAPHAKVGFYDMPHHYLYSWGYDGVNGDTYRARSNDLERIWREVDVLSPETYLHVPVGTIYNSGYEQTELDNSFFIGDAIRESIRLKAAFPNNQQIVTIGWYRYHDARSNPHRAQFLSSVDLRNQIFFGRQAGADGMLLWGNEIECDPAARDYQECLSSTAPGAREFQNYFSTQLDPIVRQGCALTAP